MHCVEFFDISKGDFDADVQQEERGVRGWVGEG